MPEGEDMTGEAQPVDAGAESFQAHPPVENTKGRRNIGKAIWDRGGKLVAKGLVVGALAFGAGSVADRASAGSTPLPDIDSTPPAELQVTPPQSEIRITAELPSDVLTKEDLEKNNIRIFNSPGTELHIRRSALERPLFKDAAEGLTGDAVIVLVDSNRVNWAASEKLAEEPKTILQSVIHNPYNRPPGIKEGKVEMLNAQLNAARQLAELTSKDLVDIPSGKAKEDAESLVRSLEAEAESKTPRKDIDYQLSRAKARLRDIESGSALETAKHRIKFAEQSEADVKKQIEALMSPDAAKLEDFAMNGATGTFIRLNGMPFEAIASLVEESHDWAQTIGRYRKVLKEHPEWASNNYLFVAVGGDLTPNPSQKPDPSMFVEKESIKEFNEDDPSRETRYRYNRPPHASITLNHEVGHYGREEIQGEYTADTKSFEDSFTPDSFIIRNSEGDTYASSKTPNEADKPIVT